MGGNTLPKSPVGIARRDSAGPCGYTGHWDEEGLSSLMAGIRRLQARLTRPSLAVVVLAWLNVALQPCALAFGQSHSSHCTHCPPGHVHDHAAPTTDAMVSEAMSCAARLADCANLGDIDHRTRDGESKPSDPPKLTWAVIWPTEPSSLPHASPERMRVSDPPCYSGAYPPLNVLFCVYLN